MNWRDTAIVLAASPFGEGAALVQVFAREQGRMPGIVHGRHKNAATLQPGTLVEAKWRARLEDHLGTLTLEPQRGFAHIVLADRAALTAMQSCLALVLGALPERDPHPAIFEGLTLILEHLEEGDVWPALLVRWELGLLSELGFGLDLSKCALTGSHEALAFVSPRTGRAANREAAAAYADKLLPLPPFLMEGQGVRPPSRRETSQGLRLTGHFLEQRVFAALGRPLPEVRVRLAENFARLAKTAKPS